jgi:hypothetical protein
VPSLKVEENLIEASQPLKFNASDSFISNAPFPESQRNLTFSWNCPDIFTDVCANFTSPILEMSWMDVYNNPNMTFGKDYSFTVLIDWMSEGKLVKRAELT